ncbi:MAG TPA: NYN domain-containing protein [Methylomusa anaerophila]|uniref:YacP-like NYN domain protein n=1 Tax=Methylomusa anaerophila TaxID=1930071 RepID=A0A348AJT7_9FIRM|nr:NYN domain-containing protein [Methylomusa anaerophila]BBB91335.1 YacP-like NYN domain protein [Methylomusa anaerophila]HML90490.1 NYN domain-containing protein [Methylomusa anaerophila]
MEILIVDGYNVINAWPDLVAVKDNLEYARDKLVDILMEYGAYKGFKTVIVFDAHLAAGKDQIYGMAGNVEVVFTKEGETADSSIEKMVYYLVRGGERVYVVTSDAAEQMMVIGAGACRLSARELKAEVAAVKKEIQDNMAGKLLPQKRYEIGNRLDHELVRRLDAIRRGGKA